MLSQLGDKDSQFEAARKKYASDIQALVDKYSKEIDALNTTLSTLRRKLKLETERADASELECKTKEDLISKLKAKLALLEEMCKNLQGSITALEMEASRSTGKYELEIKNLKAAVLYLRGFTFLYGITMGVQLSKTRKELQASRAKVFL